MTPTSSLLRRSVFEFRTRSEAVSIAQFVAASMPEPVRAELALTELVLNAIEHGSLEIGGVAKAMLVSVGGFDDEIARRHMLPPYRERCVVLEVLHDASADVVVTDQGPGFAWRSMLCGAMDEVEPAGRGIALALSSGCMISYNEAGNSVSVRFR